MKSYKDFGKKLIGESDIASLTVRTSKDLFDLGFGEDGIYRAYIVEGETEIPEHYEKVFESETSWIKIYDDTGLSFNSYELKPFDMIRIYRAREFGCILQFLKK